MWGFLKRKDLAMDQRDLWSEAGGDVFSYGNSNTGVSWGRRRKLLANYRELAYVCVKVRSEIIGRYEPIVYTLNSQGEKVEINHPFLDLLHNPAPNMSQYQLFSHTNENLDISEAFWYYQLDDRGLPVSIDFLKPDKIEISIQQDEDPTGRFQPGDVNGYIYTNPRGIQIPLEVEEVEHFKEWNPWNSYRGYGILEAGLMSAGIDISTTEFQKNFLDNNATPSSVIAFKNGVGKDTFDKIKRMWSERYQGVTNAGKSLFIREGDVEVTKLGLSLAELDMKALKDLSYDRLRTMFRVPKPLLGDSEGSGLGRGSVETEEYIFQKYVVETRKTLFDDQIRMAIKRFYGDDVYVSHISEVPEDKELKIKERTAGWLKWISTNDILEEDGKDTIGEIGDKLLWPINMIDPAEPKLPAPDMTPAEPKKFYAKKHTVQALPAAVKATSDNIFGLLEKIEGEEAARYRSKIVGLLKYQQQRMIEKYDFLSGRKDVTEQLLFNDQEEAEKFAAAVILILMQTIERGGLIGLEIAGADLQFLVDQATQQALSDSTVGLMRSFNKETAEYIRDTVAQGLRNGETRDQIAARLASVYDDATGYRAKRLAETEIHKAVNRGIAEGYRQAGISYMRWKANPGACVYCASMDNTIVQIGKPFLSVGSSVEGIDGTTFTNTYENVSHADLHPNCRCTIEPVFDARGKQLLQVEVPIEIETPDTEMLRQALLEEKQYSSELEKIVGLDGSSDET